MMNRNCNWLTTYDPFDPFTKLDKVFFGDPFFSNANTAIAAFGTDVTDEGDFYKLTADLPGFKKDEIQIDVEDGILTISAERNEETDAENGPMAPTSGPSTSPKWTTKKSLQSMSTAS